MGKEISYTATRCMSCDTKKKWQNPKLREKMTKARSTPEHKEKDREAMKKYWREGIFDGVFQSPTKPEKEIMKILKNLKLDYIFQFRPEDFGMVYDFYISKEHLLIEFDGVYWHSLKEVKLRDLKKTKYAKDNGYNLLRFDENNLNDFGSLILEKIKKEEDYART